MAPLERQRYEGAFNDLVATAGNIDVCSSTLRELHADITGAPSPSPWRQRSAVIRSGSDRWPMPAASRIDELVERVLSAPSSVPPLVRSAQVHLDLLLIHPFGDGNGRSARLFASAILLNAGYRTTLVTAVEQHSADCPAEYYRRFRSLGTAGEYATLEWIEASLLVIAPRLAHVAQRVSASTQQDQPGDPHQPTWWTDRLREEMAD